MITMYELLEMVKDEPDRSIYVKYFDRVNKKEDVMWACKENIIYKLEQLVIELNDKVEIIEEEKKTKPLTKKDIEALGYACGEIQKCFTNGWTKSLENKPLEEEKKIPEKFKVHSLGDKDENGNFVNSPFPTDEEFMNKINDIIHYLKYLKSKGE